MDESPENDQTGLTKLVLVAADVALLAAVALGWIVIWCACGAVVLALLWRAAADRAMGRRIAESWPYSGPSAFALLALAACASMAIFGGGLIALLLLAGFVLAAAVRAGLFQRDDQGGPLVMDLDAGAPEGPFRALGFAGLLGGGFPLALLLLYSDHSQVRRDGFLAHGRLVPWNRIVSWGWEFSGESQPSIMRPPDVLVLRLHRRIQFMPPLRIRIPEGRQSEVETVLAGAIRAA